MTDATVSSLEQQSLLDPEFWRHGDRASVFARFRQEAPVWWHPDTAQARGFWSLTRHAEVEAVSRDWRTFCSGLGTSIGDESIELARGLGGMLNMDSPEHLRLRRIVNRAFSPAAVTRICQTIDECARKTIEAVSDRGQCDFAVDLAQPFPVAVICRMLGAPASDWPELHRLSTIALGADGLDDAEGEGRQCAALDCFWALNRYGEEMCRELRSKPRDDLMSVIANAEVDGERLTSEEVGVFFQLLVTAGIETTGTAISQGFKALCEFPEERKRWQTDFDALAEKAVEELVRFSTPVIHFRRTATRDVALAGVPIKKGDKVVLWYLSADFDETVFAQPHRLDLGREPNPHVGYGGGGRHFCLGANLARVEIRSFFRHLFNRLPDIQVSGPARQLPSRFVNGLLSLPCEFSPTSSGR